MDETQLFRPRRAILERHELRESAGDALHDPATGRDKAPRCTAPATRSSPQLTYLAYRPVDNSRRTGLNPRRGGPTARCEEPTQYTARYTMFR